MFYYCVLCKIVFFEIFVNTKNFIVHHDVGFSARQFIIEKEKQFILQQTVVGCWYLITSHNLKNLIAINSIEPILF